MEDMEQKLGAILSNPQMMQQIMSMAQAMSQSAPSPDSREPVPQTKEAPQTTFPELDIGMLQKLSGMFRQSGADQHQQALLSALSPYLSRERVGKLERAMQAAKMARLASTFLNSGGLSILTGR